MRYNQFIIRKEEDFPMNRITRSLLAVTLAGMVSFAPAALAVRQPPATTAFAHSGRTDSSGGHRDNRNASGLGSYHYHCDGHPAHLHENGVCPYASSSAGAASSSSAANSGNGSSSNSNSVSRNTVKKVQKRLNELGYDCGTPDGVMGSKTKRALKKFQRDSGLTADGIIGKKTLEALELSK